MSKKNTFVLILAGGASSRLFPFNKILSDLTGSGKTLIQQAFARAKTIAPKEQVSVLSVDDLVRPIKKQLGLSRTSFFVDPARRGTWPALLWAMSHLRLKNPEAVLAVLTGDHVIPKLAPFKRAALKACSLAAEQAAMVMLGVTPESEATEWTGYGVFQVDGTAVTAFQEKPTLAEAQRMIKQGHWVWNSGMFFFRISTAEQALARFQPAMFEQYHTLCAAVARGQLQLARQLYAQFPAKIPHPLDPSHMVDNTIDFAIMTPLVAARRNTLGARNLLEALAVCHGLPQWTDLGQWEALVSVLKKDNAKNLCLGSVQLDSSTRDCIVAADQGFHLKIQGLSHAVIALSQRGLLLLPRAEVPRIKEHVAAAGSAPFVIVQGIPDVHIQCRGRRVVVTGAAFIR